MMNVLHDDGFSYCSSPEHEDSKLYALAPDIRIFSQRIVERSMRDACPLLLAHETLKAICLPGEAPNLDSLSAFLNMSSSDGI